MKTCTQCREQKVDSEFYKLRGSLRPNCKTCHVATVMESQRRHGRKICPVKKAAIKHRHYVRNKKTYLLAATQRKAHIKRATPPWADAEKIRFFYECCPEGYHVDHIIPLRGKRISGLHVETNLQWLPAADNLLKGNSHL